MAVQSTSWGSATDLNEAQRRSARNLTLKERAVIADVLTPAPPTLRL